MRPTIDRNHHTKPNQRPANLNIKRRTLLKGLAGAGILSAASVDQAFAETSAPLRVVLIPLQHGWGHGSDLCEQISGSEFDFNLPSIWSPFEKLRDQLLVIDGLRGTFWGNAHDVSYADLFTAGVPYKAAEKRDTLGGPFPGSTSASIDYLLEEHYGKGTLRFSARYHSFGASHHPLSFNHRQQSLPFYTQAYDAYNSLYASTPSATSKTGNAGIILAELFPYLSNDVAKQLQNLNVTQQDKLLSYLDASESLQKKLASAASSTAPTPGSSAQLSSIPDKKQSINESLDSYFDMIKVSFTNDTQRVAVLGIGDRNNQFQWTDSEGNSHSGYSDYTGDFHHNIAHYKGKPEDARRINDAWTKHYASKVADFAESLRSTIDIDGNTLLDNTIIVLTGEVGDGNHGRWNKPHIVIGGGDRLKRGDRKMGRWLNVPKINVAAAGTEDSSGMFVSIQDDADWRSGVAAQFTHADLWTKIGQLSGLSMTSFGIPSMNTQALDI